MERLCRELFRLLVIVALVFLTIGTGVARADPTWTQTSQADFESGTLVQVDTSTSPGDVKLATAGTGSNYVYALRGNKKDDFWRYDIAADDWTSLTDTPGTVKWGGALAYGGSNYIYALRGYNTKSFWQYDITSDSWISLANTPASVACGGALAYDGSNYIYALRGNNTKSFWRYDIAADNWTSLANAHDNVGGGGALTCDGGNYVYSFQCADTETLWRYDIATDSWTLMADTPGSVGNGAALAYDGSSYIYALRGRNSASFWRYNISTDNWSVMANTPRCVEWGGALAYDGGNYIYALRGRWTDDFWRYDISADSWAWRDDTPDSVAYGGALAMGGVSYYNSGNLTSSTHDTGYATDFGTISWNAATPAGTAIKFQIATNNDNSTWNFKGPGGDSGTYYTSSGAGIWTGHDNDRYIKYKAFLSTTDTSATPTFHDISITYSPQTAAPTVTTNAASLVEETTATINGTLTSDGGEACQYSFEWGTAPGTYTDNISWTGSLNSGEFFSTALSGLNKGDVYYYRARARNSAGIGNGSEMSFLTKPDPPTSFTATTVSSSQINLSWTKGDGAVNTMVRGKQGSYPTSVTDGYPVYFDTGTNASDTGLLPSTTYYYSAWSEVTGSQQWSDDPPAQANATTSAVAPTVIGGPVYPVSKMQVLAPWLGLFLALALAVGRLVFGLRKKGAVSPMM